jgi:hypothetical protein
MARGLPPGLSDEQRNALSEFYAGRITAGQLSGRLALTRAGSPRSSVADKHTSGIPARVGQRAAPDLYRLRRRWRTGLIALVVCAAGGALGAVIGPLWSPATGHGGAARDGRVRSRTNPVRRTRHHARTTAGPAGQPSAQVSTGAGVAVAARARAPSTDSRTRAASGPTTNSSTPAPTPGRVRSKLSSPTTAPAQTTSTSTTTAPGAPTPTTAPVATTTITTPTASTTPTARARRHHTSPGQNG